SSAKVCNFHDAQRDPCAVDRRCFSFFTRFRTHQWLRVKYLNGAGCAFSKATGNSHQLIQPHFPFHLHARRLVYRAKDGCWLATVSLRNANADLRIVDELRIRNRYVLLHFLVRTTLCTDRRLEKRQRAEIAITVYRNGAAQVRLSEHAHIKHISWPKQVVPDALNVHPRRLRWRARGLLRLRLLRVNRTRKRAHKRDHYKEGCFSFHSLHLNSEAYYPCVCVAGAF